MAMPQMITSISRVLASVLILLSAATQVASLQVDLDSLDIDLSGVGRSGINSFNTITSSSTYAIATLVSSEEYVHGAIALAGIRLHRSPIIKKKIASLLKSK
jgi:hypothetical protein